LANKNDKIVVKSTSSYFTGQVVNNGFANNYINLDIGTWVIMSVGRAYDLLGESQIAAPMGIGGSAGQQITGYQPIWYASFSANTNVYIWNQFGKTLYFNGVGMFAYKIA